MANNDAGSNPISVWDKATTDPANQNELKDANRNKIIACKGDGCLGNIADDFGLTVWLYYNTAFEDWVTAREASSVRTEAEKTYITNQSAYTIAIECNIISIGANLLDGGKSNFGCCLMDQSQSGGGYCLTVNSGRTDVDTYYLTNANFETVLGSPYDLSSIPVTTDPYSGITIFWIEDKSETPDTLPFTKFIGHKVQPWPDAAWAEMYRFEAGDKATGLIYNADGANSAKWYDETVKLEFAMFGFGSVMASAITCFTYLLMM